MTPSSRYKLIQKPPETTFDDLTEEVWEEFSDKLQSSNNDIDIYNINKRMEPAFKDFLLEFFLEISQSFESLSQHEIDVLYSENIENIIANTIEDYNLRDEATFRNVLEDYLKNPRENSALLDFTDNIYRGIVNIDLLSRERDTKFPNVSSIPNENKILLLDTNVIVNLLCETDRLHPLAAKVCEKSAENEFKLYYSQKTKKELNGLIGGAESEMDGIYSGNGSFETADNQFVKDFRKGDSSSWGEYLDRIKDWEENVGEWDISEFSKEIDPNGKVMTEAKEFLIEYESHLTHQSLNRIDHDAALYGYVAQLRVRSNHDFGPFILSFHNNFTDAGNKLAEVEGLRGIVGNHVLAMQARNWLNYLMSFSSIRFDDEDRKEVSLAILQGATNFDETLTIREYSRLLVPKMGFKPEDEEYLADYLRGHSLHHELQDALDKNEGHRAENVSRKIIEDDEYREVVQEQREFDERLKQATEFVGDLKDQIKQKDQRVEELESRISNLESDSGDTYIMNGGNASASADAQAEATIKADFNREYADLVDQFIQGLDESQVTLEEILPEDQPKEKFEQPPSEGSSLETKKEWLQTASAIITLSDTVPDAVAQLLPKINELFATATTLLN